VPHHNISSITPPKRFDAAAVQVVFPLLNVVLVSFRSQLFPPSFRSTPSPTYAPNKPPPRPAPKPLGTGPYQSIIKRPEGTHLSGI
jgi:hypothetical protein